MLGVAYFPPQAAFYAPGVFTHNRYDTLTDSYDITDIRTGSSFDGSRVAVITAPEQARAGSLEPLTRYLHDQGVETRLGYTGSHRQPVLRLQQLPDDATLMRLLEAYPHWQAAQSDAASIRFSTPLHFTPLEHAPAQQQAGFMQHLREHSTDLSALSYMAGNMGLVASALYGGGKGAQREWLKLGAPACYTAASAFLFFLNRQRPEPRNMEQIWDALSPDLLRDDYSPTADEQAQNRKAGGAIIGHVWELMQKHPWEVNGLLNMVGAGTHLASSLLRGQKTEAVAALSTLTAMAITTFVPEKGKHAAFAEQAFRKQGEDVALASAGEMEKHHGVFRPFFSAGKKLAGWVQEKPLRAASFIQLAANTGYGAAALTKRDAQGNRRVDYGLLASSTTFMAGNGFQAIATKTKGPSFDDIVSKAASAIAEHTAWQHHTPELLNEKLLNVATELSKQPEIGHSAPQLAAGMMERLAREGKRPADAAHQALEGFIPTEKSELKNNPFISPHQVEAVMRQHRGAELAR